MSYTLTYTYVTDEKVSPGHHLVILTWHSLGLRTHWHDKGGHLPKKGCFGAWARTKCLDRSSESPSEVCICVLYSAVCTSAFPHPLCACFLSLNQR